MNQRENFFKMLDGEAEFAPIFMELYKVCGIATGVIEHVATGQSGEDAYGARWLKTVEGFLPDPAGHRFEEVDEWKDYVHFPNLDDYDMAAMAAKEIQDEDRVERVVNVMWNCGLFDRMVAFMGFENALISLVADPEGCDEFFGEMADFKIKMIGKIIDAYKPDVVTYADDVASAQNLFMSPETYRSIIYPHQKRIQNYIASRDVICCQHTCGKCEEVIPDYVDMGVRIWSSAQCMNDIAAIQRRFGSKLIVEGGYDTAARCGTNDATVDDVLTEAERCLTEYAPAGNFILMPLIMNEKGNGLAFGDWRYGPLTEFWGKHNNIQALNMRLSA